MNSIQIPWDGWELVEQIGRGQFGTVYKISCTKYGITEYAAMKIISIPSDPQMIETDYSYGYDKESISVKYKSYLDDVLKEYQLMMMVKGNPNIVRCDDIHVSAHEDGIGWDVYIRMEYLNPLLKKKDIVFDNDEVVNIGVDLLNALIECEKNNILHRDIKPSNIMVSDNGTYKLGDFGVSRTLENENTYGTRGIGTYDYMAPEIYNGGKYGKEADIYSLGMVLYWLLNNKTFPFFPKGKAPTVQQITEAREKRFRGDKFPEPDSGSDELKKIVLKACEYEPNNRYQTAQEMLDDLIKLKYHIASDINTEKEAGVFPQSKSDDEVIVEIKTEPENKWQDSSVTVGKTYNKWQDSSQTVGKTYAGVSDASNTLNSLDERTEPAVNALSNTISFGNYHGAIEWLVVAETENQMLLLSKDILDFMPYDSESNNWWGSSVRYFLNNKFYNYSFNTKEAFSIVPFNNDKVFLLTVENVRELIPFVNRAALPSSYSKHKMNSQPQRWWLKSDGTSDNKAQFIDSHGVIDLGGELVNNSYIGIRPAIRIRKNYLNMPETSVSQEPVISDPNAWNDSNKTVGKPYGSIESDSYDERYQKTVGKDYSLNKNNNVSSAKRIPITNDNSHSDNESDENNETVRVSFSKTEIIVFILILLVCLCGVGIATQWNEVFGGGSASTGVTKTARFYISVEDACGLMKSIVGKDLSSSKQLLIDRLGIDLDENRESICFFPSGEDGIIKTHEYMTYPVALYVGSIEIDYIRLYYIPEGTYVYSLMFISGNEASDEANEYQFDYLYSQLESLYSSYNGDGFRNNGYLSSDGYWYEVMIEEDNNRTSFSCENIYDGYHSNDAINAIINSKTN